MQTRVEAILFGVIAFLIAGQILAGFSSLVYMETAGIDVAANGYSSLSQTASRR